MKRSTFKKIPAALSLTSAALLVACGGGGGGSAVPGQTNASVITPSNAQTVSKQALNGSSTLNGGATSSTSLVTGVSITGDTTARTGLVNAALQQMYKALDVPPPSSLATGVTTTAPQTVACPSGGTMTVSVTYANANTLSNGDSMTVTSNSCVENGAKLNGTLTFTFSDVSAPISQTSAWSATMALKFTNFTVEENNEVAGTSGDMTLKFNQKAAQDVAYTISGSSLRATLVKSGATVLDQTLSSYAYTGSSNSSGVTQSANFTFADNLVAAYSAYTVATITVFRQTSASSYPYTGALTVTAGNNSKATLTALDSTNVRIDVDSNGDGIADQSINTTWVALNS